MQFETLFFKHADAIKLKSSDKAVILEFIRWSCHFKQADENRELSQARYFVDGEWWMQDSLEAWSERMPWLSERTICRYINELVLKGLVLKKHRANAGGQAPNMYRAAGDCQIDRGGDKILEGSVVANLSVGGCQFGSTVVANLANPSLSKNLTKNHLKISMPPFDPPDLDLAKRWLEFASKEMPWQTSWTQEGFAAGLARIRKATDLNHEGLSEILDFIKGDEFWRNKALSPAALLAKSPNGNRKIDNLLLAIKGSRKYKSAREYDSMTEACKNYDPSKSLF